MCASTGELSFLRFSCAERTTNRCIIRSSSLTLSLTLLFYSLGRDQTFGLYAFDSRLLFQALIMNEAWASGIPVVPSGHSSRTTRVGLGAWHSSDVSKLRSRTKRFGLGAWHIHLLLKALIKDETFWLAFLAFV